MNSRDRRDMYKRIVYSNLGSICKKCKGIKNLNVHHKDHDPNNNFLSNLLLLCNKCHMNLHQTEFYIFSKLEGSKKIHPIILQQISELEKVEFLSINRLKDFKIRAIEKLTHEKGDEDDN